MKKFLMAAGSCILAFSLAVQPAYADRYKHGHGYYDDDHRHRYKHREHRGKGWGHYKQRYPRHVRVVHTYPQRYVTHSYYNEPSYSRIHCTNSANPMGLLLGGAGGGILGHQFGKGKGNTAATIGGAVLGAALGNSITQHCTERVFRDAPLHTPVYWESSRRNENYYVTATREYEQQGRYCREYQAVSTVAGRQQQTYGTACMQPDGSWQVVN
ncbi:MAG: glycine zipper 2TM domain-containing protein [Alphaproteobacteria bacterium]